MIRVRYFAAAKEAAGVDGEDVDVASCSVSALRAVLLAKRPALERVLRQSRFAIDQRFAKEEDVVGDGAEVAVIPPVAGG